MFGILDRWHALSFIGPRTRSLKVHDSLFKTNRSKNGDRKSSSKERKSKYLQTSGDTDVLTSGSWDKTKNIAAPLTDEQMGLNLFNNSPFTHLFT